MIVFGFFFGYRLSLLIASIDPTIAHSITGQLISVGVFAFFGLLISEQKKWRVFSRAATLAATSCLIFLLWSISSPLDSIECSTDVILFKDGSGSLLAPFIFALDSESYFNGEFEGYGDMSMIEQLYGQKKDYQLYDQKLIAAATLYWLNHNQLDWSGYSAEPMFIGLSAGSQRRYFDKENQGEKKELQDVLGDLGKNIQFFIPTGTSMEVLDEHNDLVLKLSNRYMEMNFNFSEKLFNAKLNSYKEGTEPKEIKENIARKFKARPQPLTHLGFKVKYVLQPKKLMRWSKKTKDYQRRGELFCNEYKRAFSWNLLRQKLKSAFDS